MLRHLSSVPQQHDAHPEPPDNRCLNDRKRKFVEAELNQDSEGNGIPNLYGIKYDGCFVF